MLTWHTSNSCGDVPTRDTLVLELHEPNTTKTVNNIIPTNSFIFILYDFIYDSTLKVDLIYALESLYAILGVN